MSSHESPVVLTVAQRVKEYKMKTQQEVNIIVAKLQAVLSEDKQPKKAFHKTRSPTGTMWHIDRDLAFDWLKINNYTDLAELPKRLNGVFNYENTLN
jgi:hypothetical protein